MTALSVVAISGNVRRPSRTAGLVQAVIDELADRIEANVRFIDLSEESPPLMAALAADKLDDKGKALVATVEAADLIIVGTPVYRASYTGVLKHLFDLVRQDAFAGKPVILSANGGSPMHGLVIEHQLRPLFGFFNAFTVPTAIYAVENDFKDYRLVSEPVLDRIEKAVSEALGVVEASVAPLLTAPRKPSVRLAAANG